MYGAGGMTPAYGAGGMTPMYGAGGRTPLLPLGGRTPAMGGRTPGGATPAMGGGGGGGAADGASAIQAAKEVATILNLAADATWCAPGVRVDIEGGTYAGKRGSIKKVSESSATATVTIEGSSSSVSVPITELRPRRPSVESGTWVRVLGGAHAGMRLQVQGGDDDIATNPDADVIVHVPNPAVEGGFEVELLNGFVLVASD
jgi:hypothetical protein